MQRHELLCHTDASQRKTADSNQRLDELRLSLEQQLTREQQHNQQMERVNHTLAQQVNSLTSLFETMMVRLPERDRQHVLEHVAAAGGEVLSVLYDAKGLAVMLKREPTR